MTIKRRSFIGGSAALLGLGLYSAHRGVRIPPLVWEPSPHPRATKLGGLTLNYSGLISVTEPLNAEIGLRAYVPEPELKLSFEQPNELIISLNNLAPAAQLLLEAPQGVTVDEQISGITRVLTIKSQTRGEVWARWQLAQPNGYRFAAIGDTGGQRELHWCIQRAYDLGALFLLHLGDFYYTEGDYKSAIDAFNSAPLPCYVSIGNHDFHDGQTVYQNFLDEIGPFNAQFNLGGVRFLNVDTASNLIPYGAGQRGAMLREASKQAAAVNNIAFTHRPLFDPLEGSSHDIGSRGERDWLIDALKRCQVSTLLSGHIHIHARDTVQGIDNIIAVSYTHLTLPTIA